MDPDRENSAGDFVLLPDWMNKDIVYHPRKDRDGFVTKSVLKLLSVFSRFRQNSRVRETRISVWVKFVTVLTIILLDALATNMFFVYINLALVLVLMVTLDSKSLKPVFFQAIIGTAIAFIICAPAVFLGSGRSAIIISSKVFVSVSLVGMLGYTSPWNEITSSLKVFHLPDIMILTFDLALKYILLLGDICLNMLTAIRLRMVGKNESKESALSGVLGNTFIRSREMSKDMYDAMVCRGFEGQYIKKKLHLKKIDIVVFVFLACLMALFIYLELDYAGSI